MAKIQPYKITLVMLIIICGAAYKLTSCTVAEWFAKLDDQEVWHYYTIETPCDGKGVRTYVDWKRLY